MTGFRKTVRDVGIILIFSLLGLALVELGAGFFAGSKYMKIEAHGNNPQVYGYFAPRQVREILFPGLKPYSVRTNDLGFRDVGVPVEAGDLTAGKRILAIGDSVTFGLFLDDKDSYPYQLQSLFTNSGSPVKILNAGIGSTSIQDHYYYLLEKGLATEPSVVIMNFCSNDLEDLKKKELLYRDINSKKDGFFKRSNIYRAFLQSYVGVKYRHWLRKIKDERSRAILQSNDASSEAVSYITEHYFSVDLFKPEMTALQAEYFGYLDRIVDVLKKKKIPLIVFAHPEILAVSGKVQRRFEDLLEQHLDGKPGVYFLDMARHFPVQGVDVLSLYNAPPRDFHLSGHGNRYLAEELFRIIQREALLGR